MSAEAKSRMSINDHPEKKTVASPHSVGCVEHNHLLDEFGLTIQALIRLHEHQFRAIMDGDTESQRFDVLIHMASEKKQLAKYAYLRHVEDHGCSKF